MFPVIQYDVANDTNADHCVSYEPRKPNDQATVATMQPKQLGLSYISCLDSLKDSQFFPNSVLLTKILQRTVGLQLQTLEFFNCIIENVNFGVLTGLNELKYLKFSDCNKIIIPNLVHLTALKKLTFHRCTWRHGELEKNTQLHMLEIRESYNNFDDGLCDLNKLSELRYLDIHGYNKISDITQLSNFSGLQKLENLVTSLRVTRFNLGQLRYYFPALHHFSDVDGPWITEDQFTMYWPPRWISEDTLNGKKRKRIKK